MKRFFYILIVFFFCINTAFAETVSAEKIYAKAYGALYKNNTKETLRILEKGIKYYPDIAYLYAGMGDAYLKEKNYDKAIEYYELATKKKMAIDIYKIDYYNATLQKTMQDIMLALNELIIATKLTENPLVYQNINYILNEKYFETKFSTEIYLNTNNVALNNANKLKAINNREAALKEYLLILNQNPQNFQAANNAGVTLMELKDYELAEKYLLIALENNKNSALILNNLAMVNFYKAKYDTMQSYFNQAINAKDDYILAINNNAIAKIHKNLNFYKPEDALCILDMIKNDYENLYAVRTLTKIYFIKGDFVSAENLIAPQDSHYNFKLFTQKAYVSLKNNNLTKALEYIDKAILLYSDNDIDYLLKARILAAMGQYSNALANFETALSKKNNQDLLYFYRAKTFYKMNNMAEANSDMKKFLELKKGNPETTQIKLLFE